jgi:hypothetical protein
MTPSGKRLSTFRSAQYDVAELMRGFADEHRVEHRVEHQPPKHKKDEGSSEAFLECEPGTVSLCIELPYCR